MKIRNGFVSNSSSSSFIVIEGEAKIKYKDEVYTIGEKGECEFGWQQETYNDFDSKVNWCYLQAKQLDNKEYLNMLIDSIKESYKFVVPICNKKNYSYIDHQSVGDEAPMNIRMFDNPCILRRFLYSDKSFIQCDNDNH